MATPLKLATFNCENLFSRAKLLNMADRKKAAGLLEKVAQLQRLLELPDYAAADKSEILRLTRELSLYIWIAENRGDLFGGRGTRRRVVASGAGDWDGAIAFRRASFKDLQRGNTARVVQEIDADLQCLVEVEDRKTLDAFNSQLLGRRYAYNMLIDGFDPRGIDVGLFSRHPIRTLRSHLFDRDSRGRVFSRDCLEAEVEIRPGVSLHLLVNHFKSQGFGDQRSNDAKRLRQARAVARIVAGRYDLRRDLVAVLGDFNDSPGRPPDTLAPLLTMAGLSDVLALQFADPADRWTYHFRKNEQIDFILVSDALKAAFSEAGVERRGMPDLALNTVSGEAPFDEVTGASSAASDHAAVWASFML